MPIVHLCPHPARPRGQYSVRLRATAWTPGGRHTARRTHATRQRAHVHVPSTLKTGAAYTSDQEGESGSHVSSQDQCVRGPVGTLFSLESSGEPRFAPGPLTLAHLLLFHRRLDGVMATTRALDPVKIRCKSEQTRERKRSRRPGSIVNGLHSDCDRWPCWSMMPLFPRATSLSD